MDERELQHDIKEYYESSFGEVLEASSKGGDVQYAETDPPWWLQKLGVHSGGTFYPQFLCYLNVRSGKRLLDIACGLGGLLMMAETKGMQTHGLDISSKGVEIARLNTPRSDLIQATGEVLPYRDEVFDYVTCIGSLEHMLHPEMALREMRRVCAEGGKLCILVPNAHFLGAYRNLLKKADTYQQLTGQLYEKVDTLDGWRDLMTRAGWSILRVKRDNRTWMQQRLSTRQKLKLLLNPILPARLSYGIAFVCEKRAT